MAEIRRMESVCRLAEVVGVEVDLDDEHSRYAFYKSMSSESRWRLSLLACLLAEPNTDVSTAVALALLEEVAPWERAVVVLVAPSSGRDRVDERVGDLALLELLLSCPPEAEDIGSATDTVLESLIGGSDWLQRRVVDEVQSLFPLSILAERGRTKKVRARAAERSRSIRRR